MQRSLLAVRESAATPVRPALLGKGFRPFFLLAAAYVAVAMPLWVVALSGKLELGAYFGATYWHAHEMVFGFAVAVIAGFLLTAIGNWTGQETVVGAPLGALALLWICGRVLTMFSAHIPGALVAVGDLAFLPALALACARPVMASKNRRNYVFLVLLGALFSANLAMHLGALGAAPALIRHGAWAGVEIEVSMIVIISGRVLPMFTRNATGVAGIRSLPVFERIALAGVLLVTLGDAFLRNESAVALVSVVTGIAVFARALHWGSRHTLAHPLLWVLHLANAFVAVGFVLRGVALLVPALPPTAPLHALTAGGIGLATLGMMARVSLGHTGRMLAAPRPVAVAFALAAVAALVRVLAPLFGTAAYLPSMATAGVLFALAFGIFLVVYFPILASPRVDGKAG